MTKQFVLPAALLLALGATTALTAPAAFAQTPAAPPTAAQPAPPPPAGNPAGPQHAHHAFHSHIEGRIAYLKAELKITPAQEPQFDKVAQAMRENASERQKDFQDMRASHGQQQTAVDRLDSEIKMAQTHAREDQRFLTAFKPLYDSLSPDQKQAADDMYAPHRFGRFGGPHRG